MTSRGRKRIVFFSTVQGYQWPGSEYLWADAARDLLKQDHACSAFVSDDFRGAKALEELKEQGLRVKHLSPPRSAIARRWRSLMGPSHGWDRAKDLLVVSCGSLFDPCFCHGLAESLLKTSVPYLLVCQFNAETFWFDNAMRDMMREVYGRSAGAVFISRQNASLAERQLATSIENVKFITNPIWIDEAKRNVPFPRVDESSPIQMACVARLDTRWKGQDVLFDVLRRKCWETRNWHLNLYGEGPEELYLRQLADHYQLSSRISFRGVEGDISKVWSANHIQVLPTRAEGGPMVITEGMACGRAAVTTNCGHIPEFVEDGVNGFLADFPTSECFATAMERAWEARENWEEMGTRARRSVSHIANQGSVLSNFVLETL